MGLPGLFAGLAGGLKGYNDAVAANQASQQQDDQMRLQAADYALRRLQTNNNIQQQGIENTRQAAQDEQAKLALAQQDAAVMYNNPFAPQPDAATLRGTLQQIAKFHGLTNPDAFIDYGMNVYGGTPAAATSSVASPSAPIMGNAAAPAGLLGPNSGGTGPGTFTPNLAPFSAPMSIDFRKSLGLGPAPAGPGGAGFGAPAGIGSPAGMPSPPGGLPPSGPQFSAPTGVPSPPGGLPSMPSTPTAGGLPSMPSSPEDAMIARLEAYLPRSGANWQNVLSQIDSLKAKEAAARKAEIDMQMALGKSATDASGRISAVPLPSQEQQYRQEVAANPMLATVNPLSGQPYLRDPDAATGTRTMPVASAMGPFGPSSPQPTKSYPIAGDAFTVDQAGNVVPKFPSLLAYPRSESDQISLATNRQTLKNAQITGSGDARKQIADVAGMDTSTPAARQRQAAAFNSLISDPNIEPLIPRSPDGKTYMLPGMSAKDVADLTNTSLDIAKKQAESPYWGPQARAELQTAIANGNLAAVSAWEKRYLAPHEAASMDASANRNNTESGTMLSNQDEKHDTEKQEMLGVVSKNMQLLGAMHVTQDANGKWIVDPNGASYTDSNGKTQKMPASAIWSIINQTNSAQTRADRLDKVMTAERSPGPVASNLVGTDFGTSGCARGAGRWALNSGIPFPTTQDGSPVASVKQVRAWLSTSKNGYATTSDPSQATFFIESGSGGSNNPSGMHMGVIENGRAYQADGRGPDGKIHHEFLPMSEIPSGKGVVYYKYVGKGGGQAATGGNAGAPGKQPSAVQSAVVAEMKRRGWNVK